MRDKLLIVDGNSILNRAFYAIKGARMLTTSDGTPTNAVYGFLNILNKYIEEESPNYLTVAFDLKGKTFRHEIFDHYKANRKGMPHELAQQMPIVKKVLMAMNITIAEEKGLEADDLIGIYSKAAEDKGIDVSVLTGDRDALQLVSQSVTVIIPSTSKGKTTTNRYTPEEVINKYEVEPLALIEVKGLMGDSSDNIPGVKGVGEKTATELIKKYGSIEKVYENLDDIKRPKLKSNLDEGRELAFLSRKLGTIIREKETLDDISRFDRKDYNKEELLAIFKELEFNSFIKKLNLEQDDPSQQFSIESLCYEELDQIDQLKETINEFKEKKQISILPIISKADKVGGVMEALGIGENDKYYYINTIDIDDQLVFQAIEPILNKSQIVLISYKIKEFYTWALSFNSHIKCKLFDMMIAEYLIDALSPNYSIPNLANKYLGIELQMPKTEKGKGKQVRLLVGDDNTPELTCKALFTFEEIYKKQKQIIDESQQNNLYYDVELPLSIVLASMEYYGFKVDKDFLEKFGKNLEHQISSLEQSIHIMAGEKFNVNSPKQIGIILFEKMGLKSVKKTKTGYSTDADSLNAILDSHDIIPCILEYRQLTKLKSTYADGLVKEIHPVTGRIHSSFNQTVTATGRISSTEPNLQNIPIRTELGREIRQAFIPKEGSVFVDADYSQIELRVLAHITQDKTLIKAFEDGIDIHSLTASEVFNVSIDEVTSEMRRNAKAVNFGIIYGIGDFSLAKDIGVTRKEAARYIDGYLSTYPKVRDYMSNTVETAKSKGYVETLFHRMRYIPEIKSSNYQVREFGKRVAMNAPIQGSAADIIKIAMIKVFRELQERNLKSRLILQVHDELIVETVNEELEEVKDIVKKNMQEAANLAVPLIVDLAVGSTWYDAK